MATKKPKGLGLGLEALLGPKVSDTPAPERDGMPSTLKLEQMQAGKYQPRTRMDEGSLYELAESIKAQGIMQPILVRPIQASGAVAYEIIAGERRFRAAKLAGLREVPVLVKAVPDESAAAMALIENIQPVQNMLMAGDIDMGHARALLPLDGAAQITTASEIAAKKLSVREAEKLVARTQGAARQAPLLRVKSDKSRDVLRLEEELADALGATVEVRVKKATKRGQSGELAIHFDSLDALSGILDKLRGS